jgi:hypothetical protein
VKGKIVLYKNNSHAIGKHGSMDERISPFITSALVGHEWSASCTGRFIYTME